MLRYPIADYQVALTALAATGTSAPFVLPFSDITALVIKLFLSAVTGTSPTLDLYLQTMGPDGNWYDMYHWTQQTTATTTANGVWATITCDDGARAIGVVGSKTIGANALGVPILTNQFRLAYTIGGTTPVFTGTVDVYAANADRSGF